MIDFNKDTKWFFYKIILKTILLLKIILLLNFLVNIKIKNIKIIYYNSNIIINYKNTLLHYYI